MLERHSISDQPLPIAPGNPPHVGEFTVSDERIIQILTRLGPILHEQIADGGTFFERGGGRDHRLAHPLSEKEVTAWESVFDIDVVLGNAVASRSLFIVDIDGEQLELPSEPHKGGLVRPHTTGVKQFAGQAGTDSKTRVNYGDEAHWVPTDRLKVVESTDGLSYLINPSIHFGGYLSSPGNLYNAFVALDTFVQAPNGTQLVSQIPGTGNASWNSPVFSPYRPIETSLWMNTSIKEDEPNSLSVRSDRVGGLMLGCAINDVEELAQLDIPESDKLRTWFWQVDRLMNKGALALPVAGENSQIETS